MTSAGRTLDTPEAVRDPLARSIARAAEPLPDVGAADFAQLFDRFGDARVVLLGEATQGTSEFYRARAAITRWLIERRGFTLVALEADDAEARVFDAYVHGREPPRGGPDAGARFPDWRWRNAEFLGFLDWLRTYNAGRSDGPQTGIRGLDLFNLSGSARAALDYLERIDPSAAAHARRRFRGQTPWGPAPDTRDPPALTADYARHGTPVVATLSEVLGRQAMRMAADGKLRPGQAARLARDAEAHYRALYYGWTESWSLRAAHMLETLDGVLALHGSDAKAVVWAHNAHVGDSLATEMGVLRDELSLGHRCREVWGEEAALIGFGTHAGTVACAGDWDAPLTVKRLSRPPKESCEGLAHAAGLPRYLLDLRPGRNDEARRALADARPERFIGPVYSPEFERGGHYADCRLAQQFDAWVWFDETTAVTPLAAPGRPAGDEGVAPAPWPFGP